MQLQSGVMQLQCGVMQLHVGSCSCTWGHAAARGVMQLQSGVMQLHSGVMQLQSGVIQQSRCDRQAMQTESDRGQSRKTPFGQSFLCEACGNPSEKHENKWYLTCSELHKGKFALVVDVDVDDTRTYGGTENWSDMSIIACGGNSRH